MKSLACTLFLIALTLQAMAQLEDVNEIITEGKTLYKLERASWLGTDVLQEQHRNLDGIGGYFSYIDNDTVKNVYYSQALTPRILATISFDTAQIKNIKTDFTERPLTKMEQDLFVIRAKTEQALRDDFFRRYDSTNFNIVPLITGNSKKAIILTAPTQNGVMIFGNDYVLTFDDAFNITDKKRLHQSFLKCNFGNKEIVTGIHTHITSDFFTSTDICTLMLYEKMFGLKNYMVISRNHTWIWDCTTDELARPTMRSKSRKKSKRNRHEE